AFILAIFFGFGIYVFGFNMERSAEKLANARDAIDKKMEEMNKKTAEMNAATKKLEDAEKQLVSVQTNVKSAEQRVTEAVSHVTGMQGEIERHLIIIKGQSKLSFELVAQIQGNVKGREQSETLANVTLTASDTDKVRTGTSAFEKTLWKNGITLKIAFL